MAGTHSSEVFAVVDARNATGFSHLFSESGRIRFGNSDPLVGRAAIEAGVGGFFSTIEGLHHTVVREWMVSDETILELSVRYDRLDGMSVTIPVVTIWRLTSDRLFEDYRVYFDLTPVYAEK